MSRYNKYKDTYRDDSVGNTALAIIGLSLFAIGSSLTAIIECEDEKLDDIEKIVAKDAGVEEFEAETITVKAGHENDKYLMNFTGTAMKFDGSPIQFLEATYEINHEQFKKIKDIHDGVYDLDKDLKFGFLKTVLDTVKHSKFVSLNEADEMGVSMELGENEKTLIKSVELPVIDEEKGIVYFGVETLHYNTDEDKDAKVNVVKSVVATKLTDELKKNPSLIYSMGKDEIKAKVLSKDEYTLTNLGMLNLGNTKTSGRV